MANTLRSVIGGKFCFTQTFTASGTFYMPVNSGLLTVYLSGCGAGGGGGRSTTANGGGGGGGAGESVKHYPILLDMGSGNITVTLGTAGAGQGGASGAGSAGTATTFGSILSLAFGSGGAGGAASAGGASTVKGGDGSNGVYDGSSATATAGAQPEDQPVWIFNPVAGLLLPYWRQDGSGGGSGNTSANVGGDSGDSYFRNIDNTVTTLSSGPPATAYEGGSGGSSSFGSGGKREGALGDTSVITPGYGGGGAGGVNAVITGQTGGAGYLEVLYFL